MIKDAMHLIEEEADGQFITMHRANKVLYDAQSKFQKIVVFENDVVGRALALDGVFNVSTRMEAHYHEPMAHIPMAMVITSDSDKVDVLVIGGGDFGVAQHVLKHHQVESVTLCELDPKITEVSRKFFTQWADNCDADKRFQVIHEDGSEFLQKGRQGIYDAIIIDTTDPHVHAPALIKAPFYKKVREKLKPNGVMLQIIGDLIFYRDGWTAALPEARKVFECTAPIFVPIPFYLTGCWGLLLAGRDRELLPPTLVSDDFLKGIRGVRTMTSELVAGWFSQPQWIEARLPGNR